MNRAMARDAITELSDLGVIIGWVPSMRYPVLWIEEDCVMILSSDRPREELCDVVRALLPAVRRVVEHSC